LFIAATYVGFAMLAIVIGGAYLWLPIYEIYYRKKSRASLSWPRVTGTVSSAQVVGRSGVYGTSIMAEVIYHYEVNGVPYEGTRIGFNQVFYATKEEARAALTPYPANSNVTVSFDPANPADAILAREYRPVLRGIVFLYCALAFIIFLLVIGRHFNLDPNKPAAGAQIQVQPWVPPPLVKEPSGNVDITRDPNVKSEPSTPIMFL
jgi:hypothetical protein